MNPNNTDVEQEHSEHTQLDTSNLPNSLNKINSVQGMQTTEPPIKKKLSGKKIILITFGVITAIPVVYVLFVVVSFFLWVADHGNELSALKKETTSLFQSSNLTVSGYDCHDVELQNQCYFNVSQTNTEVSDYLLQNGFSDVSTVSSYRKEYKKDKFYITTTDNEEDRGHYESHYRSN